MKQDAREARTEHYRHFAGRGLDSIEKNDCAVDCSLRNFVYHIRGVVREISASSQIPSGPFPAAVFLGNDCGIEEISRQQVFCLLSFAGYDEDALLMTLSGLRRRRAKASGGGR